MQRPFLKWLGFARRMVPNPVAGLLRPVYHGAYRVSVVSRCRCIDVWERSFRRNQISEAVPPAMLRFRVGEAARLSVFLKVGKESAANLLAAVQAAGVPFDSLERIMDFGCGCGRSLMWLAKMFPQKDYYGVDTDREAVSWCQSHLPFGRFTTNTPLPPLEFRSGAFDLVYAISVFTHLDGVFLAAWLPELRPAFSRIVASWS